MLLFLRKLPIYKLFLILCFFSLFSAFDAFAMDAAGKEESPTRKVPTIRFNEEFSLEPVRSDLSLASVFCDIFSQDVAALYEDGNAWTTAKAERKIKAVGPRVDKWEAGDNSVLPWVFIYEKEAPIGVFLAAYDKSQDYPRRLEIACALKKDYWGKGLTLQAGMAYAKVFLPPLLSECEGLYATVHPDNVKSRRAMEKNGFMLAKDTYYPSWAPSQEPVFQRVDYTLSIDVMRKVVGLLE